MDVLKIIERVNGDSNVETVYIVLNSDNDWNDEIIRIMMSRYSNLYSIYMDDYSNWVDHELHGLIKQWM